VSTVGNFLFASNCGSNDVSVFTVNGKTGALTLVAGSPFATGGTACNPETCGIALSATPGGKFLMAANFGSNNVTLFSIASRGALAPIVGSPFAALSAPDGIKVSPNGKFLAVAEPLANQVEMFSIAANGALTSLGAFAGEALEVPGSHVGGVDIDCASRLLYGGLGTDGGTAVGGYRITRTGALTALPGAPFLPGVGVNSNVVLLGYGPGRKTLFVSNQDSATITVFSVAPNGNLSLLHGSPFPMNSRPYGPSGMATSRDGRLLYVANSSNNVSVFRVNEWGALTEVAGSPFPTGQSGGMESLTAFPPRRLSLLEALLDGCPAGPQGGFLSREE
jgi:6-phosphogluconolactonase (cycloisomerase 2 family)